MIEAQPVRDSDAICGAVPRAAYAPASVDECAELMAMAARDRLRLGFVGGGTALGLGAPPRGLDAVIRTERLANIVEHVPADMVVIAEAGVTLAALSRALAPHGQRLALDAPLPERATVGGLVACGAYGPLRMRYGAVRDLIIGVTLVRADGDIARGGGKVVKNVAGFDLPKVVCGSLGTLGMIATAAFRLHPIPEVVTTVLVANATADAVARVLAAARAAQLEPACAVCLRMGDRFDLGVRFEGFGRGVEHQVARLVELAHTAGHAAQPLADGDSAALWARHDAVRNAGPVRVRIAALPTHLPRVAPVVAELGDFAWYPGLGIGFAGGAVDDPTRVANAIERARALLIELGGSLVVENAPESLRAIDPWGPPPPSFPIMQRLKQRFDPHSRMNPGRFVGGL